MNLAVLLFYKYGPLAAVTFGMNTKDEGSLGHFLFTLPLPIGISFFTFQGISLVVDVFRQKEDGPQTIRHQSVWHHFVDTALFKGFFPQLIAGPIMKAHDFYPQIKPKYFREIRWEAAFQALVRGYFLKMVVADNLKDKVVEAILSAARTGHIGDGKIFISRVEEAIRIRNDERGENAL